jgi:hypothetical protein
MIELSPNSVDILVDERAIAASSMGFRATPGICAAEVELLRIRSGNGRFDATPEDGTAFQASARPCAGLHPRWHIHCIATSRGSEFCPNLNPP